MVPFRLQDFGQGRGQRTYGMSFYFYSTFFFSSIDGEDSL